MKRISAILLAVALLLTSVPALADYYVGQIVSFGHYPQSSSGMDNNPIEWIVLDVHGNKALIISRYALDCKPYNTTYKDVTWQTCTLRTWLNKDFYNRAFSDRERAAILTTTVDNSNSQMYIWFNTSSSGGRNTQDKIFLLSYKEAFEYFPTNESRICTPTYYAFGQGSYKYDMLFAQNDHQYTRNWWLRSPDDDQDWARFVTSTGGKGGYQVDWPHGIRPALWVNLSSGIF